MFMIPQSFRLFPELHENIRFSMFPVLCVSVEKCVLQVRATLSYVAFLIASQD